MKKERNLVAKLANELYAGKITFEEFLMNTPEDNCDKEIDELIDLIEHEPKRGGFMGVTAEEHDNYLEKIKKIIQNLSQ